eukprot:6178498-Pleurochrysis_carterae.AAC.1
MQGFTKRYVEQCTQDRAAIQHDAAAPRALLKAMLAQQKEIAESCRQMQALNAPPFLYWSTMQKQSVLGPIAEELHSNGSRS